LTRLQNVEFENVVKFPVYHPTQLMCFTDQSKFDVKSLYKVSCCCKL